MPVSVNHALKLGIVSGKAAAKWKKPAILSATRSQRGQMTGFDRKQKDEGVAKNYGVHDTNVINSPMTQKDRASSLPSSKAGRSKNWGGVARTKSTQGGRVLDSYTPGWKAIDQYPQKQKSNWPAGGGVNSP